MVGGSGDTGRCGRRSLGCWVGSEKGKLVSRELCV